VSPILKACSCVICAQPNTLQPNTLQPNTLQPNTKQGQKPAYEKKTRAIHVTVSSRYKATPWDTLDMFSEEHSQVLMMLHCEAVWCSVAQCRAVWCSVTLQYVAVLVCGHSLGHPRYVL